MKSDFLIALEIAREGHKGQFRKDGVTPYIEHPIAVANLIPYIINEDDGHFALVDLTRIVAIAHDLAEDTNITESTFMAFMVARGAKLSSISYKAVFNALKLLNKNNYDSYLEFILAVKKNRIARFVKIADITHNLSDLKPGSLRDKYELALYILNN